MAKTVTSETKKTTTAKKTAESKKSTKKTDDQSQASTLVAENTVFTLTIPAAQIESARQNAVKRAQQGSKMEGFRKGKVPAKLLEQRLGESGLRDMILEEVLPVAYRQAIIENKYIPLTDPDVRVESVIEGQDWKFSVSIAQPPEITLGDYQTIAKKVKKDHPAWTKTLEEIEKEHEASHAGYQKSEDDEHHKAHLAEHQKQDQLSALIEAILEKVNIRIPELLLRRETERQLREMEQQLEQLNITVEKYLQTMGRTLEDLQQEIAARTLMSLQVEFLLGAVVRDNSLSVTETELSAVIPTTREVSADERQYFESQLLKQKAVDYLLSL